MKTHLDEMKRSNKQCLFDTPAQKWSIQKMMSEHKQNIKKGICLS